MNEHETSVLQVVAEYYRNKCNKLEYDFVIYQAQSQKTINELAERISELSQDQGSRDGSRENNDSA